VERSAERVRDVEQHTAELRKELGLPTLVLIYLNRLMPLEGGLYQWATVGFGELGGFLTAWNLWAFAILILATFGVMIATNLSYLVGASATWLTGAAWYTPIISSIAIVFITFLALYGLRAGKWMQGIGGAAQLLTYAALLIVPFVALSRGMISEYHPFAASIPELNALNLNLLGKMALGALSGFEYVALLAGECKNPARTIGRSVIIASPVIALMFILGTSTVVALVPKDQIDLVSPIPQTLTIAFKGMGFASIIAPLLIGLLLLRQIGNVSLMFAGTTRLPMVAGWDGLLPKWFTRLHPRSHVPVNSILFVGALTLAFTLAGQVGVGLQEAFQVLENAGGIFYAFAYVSLFSIPLFAAHRLSERPKLWLRGAAVAGLATSILYSVLSIFPIIDVPDWRLFTAKVVSVLVGANAIGLAIFLTSRRRRSAMSLASLAVPGREQT
jgi:amino acid transporter